MYTEFFKLTEAPFQLTPDARYFFASDRHKRALDCLKFGLSRGEGFVLVTGEVGAGKTTLIAYLLSNLQRSRFAIATIVSTQVSSEDLLRMVAESFGIDQAGASKATIILRLQTHFERTIARNAMPVIIVDEAQNLSPEALEELRMLSNFRFGHHSSLLTVLVGQPQFRDKMADPNLLQLRQRVVVSYHLEALSVEDTATYIRHRLSQSGWKDDPAISDDALHAVYFATDGVPRLINLLFSRVLLYVYLEERHEIRKEDVELVADDMSTELTGRPSHAKARARTEGEPMPEFRQ